MGWQLQSTTCLRHSSAEESLSVSVCGYSTIEVCVGDINLCISQAKQEFTKQFITFPLIFPHPEEMTFAKDISIFESPFVFLNN